MIAALAAGLAGCLGYVPGRQSYWDNLIRDLCAKDGGVQVIEQVVVSKEEFIEMPRSGGLVGVAPKALARSSDLLYSEQTYTVLRDANPQVWRLERLVKRAEDQRLVARIVSYSRVGGDIPSPAHSSSFACPSEKAVLLDLQRMFVVRGESK